MGSPFVKVFVEERDLTVFLIVDISGSLNFGSRAILKRELAAEVSALLSFAALRNQDRVGAALVSDRLELFFDEGLFEVRCYNGAEYIVGFAGFDGEYLLQVALPREVTEAAPLI